MAFFDGQGIGHKKQFATYHIRNYDGVSVSAPCVFSAAREDWNIVTSGIGDTVTNPLRPSALAEQACFAGLRSLCAAMRATERERVRYSISYIDCKYTRFL